MAYRIEGLPLAAFEPLLGLDDTSLAERGIVRVTADGGTGFPCRMNLSKGTDDGEPCPSSRSA